MSMAFGSPFGSLEAPPGWARVVEIGWLASPLLHKPPLRHNRH
ncbi:hypothetical protein SNARM312S_02966 [Streptomyces narbonensis]